MVRTETESTPLILIDDEPNLQDLEEEESEVELAYLIAVPEIGNHSPYAIYSSEPKVRIRLTREQEIELAKRIKQGDLSARDDLILHNVRLVMSIANRLKFRYPAVPIDDLYQDGMIGLMRAIDKFDYQRGFKLSTYATWWITKSIERAMIDNERHIRLPQHAYQAVSKAERVRQTLIREYEREPSLAEVAARAKVTVDTLIHSEAAYISPISLQSPVGENEDSELSNFVADEKSPEVGQDYENQELTTTIDNLINTLPPREAQIIRQRFGLNGFRKFTLDEIGKMFGVTRERARQIEIISLKRLKALKEAKNLKVYLEG